MAGAVSVHQLLFLKCDYVDLQANAGGTRQSAREKNAKAAIAGGNSKEAQEPKHRNQNTEKKKRNRVNKKAKAVAAAAVDTQVGLPPGTVALLNINTI